MPYQMNAGVADAGVFHALGTIVSDDDGARMLLEHPSSLTRIAHDDDLCVHMVGGCAHDSHDWNTTAPTRSSSSSSSASTDSSSAASSASAGV